MAGVVPEPILCCSIYLIGSSLLLLKDPSYRSIAPNPFKDKTTTEGSVRYFLRADCMIATIDANIINDPATIPASVSKENPSTGNAQWFAYVAMAEANSNVATIVVPVIFVIVLLLVDLTSGFLS